MSGLWFMLLRSEKHRLYNDDRIILSGVKFTMSKTILTPIVQMYPLRPELLQAELHSLWRRVVRLHAVALCHRPHPSTALKQRASGRMRVRGVS